MHGYNQTKYKYHDNLSRTLVHESLAAEVPTRTGMGQGYGYRPSHAEVLRLTLVCLKLGL